MADVATNNPVGRLHVLLGQIRLRYESSPDPQARVHSALAVMWDLPWPQERPALLRRVADLDGLSTLVVGQITALQEHPAVDLEDCLAAQDSWRAALEALMNPYGLLSAAGQYIEPSTQRDLAPVRAAAQLAVTRARQQRRPASSDPGRFRADSGHPARRHRRGRPRLRHGRTCGPFRTAWQEFSCAGLKRGIRPLTTCRERL